MLSEHERERYSRHLLLPQVGLEGQEKLKASSAAVIGAGGLGSPVALYLASAGVGRIGIVDFDRVDLTNLHRQILHGEADIGRKKVESAAERLREANPHVEVELHDTTLTSRNAMEILGRYDVVVDGTDNFATRYLVNDACVLLGKPNVYGSIFRFEGQASVFHAKVGPCYRCLYPDPPPPQFVPSCAEGGVLGILPGVVGTIQATEALKILLGIESTLVGRLLLFDALRMEFRELRLRKDPRCKVCGTNPEVTELIDYEQFCGTGRSDEVSVNDRITPLELKEKLDRGEKIKLVDVREQVEWNIARIEGAELIPLGTLPDQFSRLNKEDEIVLYCRSGSRSARATHFLRQQGFNAANLEGGILRWSREVDPSIPRY
jgi:molybdopterin/thiamine biosynthesis adenylyltransferase/rhodanese-related sulfurtransferase